MLFQSEPAQPVDSTASTRPSLLRDLVPIPLEERKRRLIIPLPPSHSKLIGLRLPPSSLCDAAALVLLLPCRNTAPTPPSAAAYNGGAGCRIRTNLVLSILSAVRRHAVSDRTRLRSCWRPGRGTARTAIARSGYPKPSRPFDAASTSWSTSGSGACSASRRMSCRGPSAAWSSGGSSRPTSTATSFPCRRKGHCPTSRRKGGASSTPSDIPRPWRTHRKSPVGSEQEPLPKTGEGGNRQSLICPPSASSSPSRLGDADAEGPVDGDDLFDCLIAV